MGVVKAVLGEKFIEDLKSTIWLYTLRNQKKKSKLALKSAEGIIKVREKIGEKEGEKTQSNRENQQNKKLVLWKDNKIDKTLVRLKKKKMANN